MILQVVVLQVVVLQVVVLQVVVLQVVARMGKLAEMKCVYMFHMASPVEVVVDFAASIVALLTPRPPTVVHWGYTEQMVERIAG
jgi:hypothetical protein